MRMCRVKGEVGDGVGGTASYNLSGGISWALDTPFTFIYVSVFVDFYIGNSYFALRG